MLPFLWTGDEEEMSVGDITDKLALQFKLTDDQRAQLLPSGKQTKFSNRVQWAKTYLVKAGLIQPTKRAHFKITERGRSVLKQDPPKIDIKFLTQFDEFNKFRFPTRRQRRRPCLIARPILRRTKRCALCMIR